MKTLSIIIPIFHDRATIGQTIDTLVNFFAHEHLNAELIIVNDGGADGGSQIVREKMIVHPGIIRFCDRSVNRGKGFSVREGLRMSRGNFIFYTDADLPYLVDPIRHMLDLLEHQGADLVLVNRELSHATKSERPSFARRITHWIYSRFVRILIPLEFSDTLAGLKGMRKRVVEFALPRLTINRFSFDVELLLVAKDAGFDIRELPVSLKNVGKSNLRILRDAPQMVSDILRIALQHYRGRYRQ